MIIILSLLPFIIMVMITLYDRKRLDFFQRKFYSDGAGNGMLLGIFLMVGFIVIISTLPEPRPTALDVYRNKTELEITYKNTTPVDSTVIWKKL